MSLVVIIETWYIGKRGLTKRVIVTEPLIGINCFILVLEDKHGLSVGEFDKPYLIHVFRVNLL